MGTNLWLRLKALARRKQLDRDLEDEIAFHLAMREQSSADEHASPELARSTARRRFGNATSIRETV
ncbi:MAG TPA: permease prefix domain 1-containing protein, partial [Bryobacteraceae bacterium]|nr:permease prefix domain 1-containing protein [Bryobacteraceae bacterium]